MTKDNEGRKVREAAVAYITSRDEGPAVSTISSKNQITLPVQLLREMGLGPGDRLAITREDGRLVMRARPKDWVQYHAGSFAGVYGRDRDEIERELRAGREDEARDAAIEGAWAGQRPAPAD